MYTEEKARQLVIEAGLKLVEDDLVARTWGNVSARCGDNEMIITPSGIAYDRLTPEKLVKVNIVDLSYDSDIKPSSEKGIHAAVYRMRKDINFVIHTHQTYASAIAADERDLPYAPCAAYGLPGTDTLKKHVIRTLEDHPNHTKFLLAKHGALLLGENMEDAFNMAEQLENDCMEEFKSRIPSLDVVNWQSINVDKYQTKDNPYVKLVQNEFIGECCKAGATVKPYIDDFAQIVGPDMAVVDYNHTAVRVGLVGRNAILVKGIGAICVGETEDDCEAVAYIVNKNCAAACYVRKAGPLSKADALTMRMVYLTKYSKKKNG